MLSARWLTSHSHAAPSTSKSRPLEGWLTNDLEENGISLPLGLDIGGEEDPSLTVATVFLEQRFPQLRFEWKIEHPAYELEDRLCDATPGREPFVMRTSWSAYLRAGEGASSLRKFVLTPQD